LAANETAKKRNKDKKNQGKIIDLNNRKKYHCDVFLYMYSIANSMTKKKGKEKPCKMIAKSRFLPRVGSK